MLYTRSHKYTTPKWFLIAWLLWNFPRITHSSKILEIHHRIGGRYDPNWNNKQPFEDDIRIVGGTTDDPGFDHSWMIAFGYQGHAPWCGGSLISKNVILTAAHCFSHLGVDGDFVKIGTVGENREIEFFVENEKLTPGLNYFQHENYNPTTFLNDIAVVSSCKIPVYDELNDFLQNDSIELKPIELPRTEEMDNIAEYIVFGWGLKNEGGESSKLLRWVKVPVVSYQNCSDDYSDLNFSFLYKKENIICAGMEGKDACQADSGGPLMNIDSETSNTVLRGIVSWGIGCARKDNPGIYTNVFNYLTWIENQISKYENICDVGSGDYPTSTPFYTPQEITYPVFPECDFLDCSHGCYVHDIDNEPMCACPFGLTLDVDDKTCIKPKPLLQSNFIDENGYWKIMFNYDGRGDCVTKMDNGFKIGQRLQVQKCTKHKSDIKKQRWFYAVFFKHLIFFTYYSFINFFTPCFRIQQLIKSNCFIRIKNFVSAQGTTGICLR